MKKWIVEVHLRKLGALGISYMARGVVVAMDRNGAEQAFREKWSKTHGHIHVNMIREVKPGE